MLKFLKDKNDALRSNLTQFKSDNAYLTDLTKNLIKQIFHFKVMNWIV